VGIVNVEGHIIWSKKWLHAAEASHTEVLRQTAALINEGVKSAGIAKLSGIGICIHGLVKSEDGLLVFGPNLAWENVRIGDTFENEFHVSVIVENDVRAMTLAENWCGVARGIDDYVCLYIGPGIGGSIVIGGELYRGCGGFAGEFGHNTIKPDGPLCTCGNRGCLQAVASESTVLSNFLIRKNDARYARFAYEDVVRLAKQGDPVAVDEILKSAQYIGIEIGNIINSLGPPLVVLSGSFTSLGGMVMSVIDDEVRHRGLKYAQTNTRILFSSLGEKAFIKGAAACITREMFGSPKKFLKAGNAEG
jgi:predicted NBD/HSP70 family sugar kinase